MAKNKVKPAATDPGDHGDDLEYAHLERDLLIDKHALDDAIENQPELVRRVGEAAVMARSRADAAKDALKESAARLQLTLREKMDLAAEKYTEKSLESMVLVHPDHIAARKKLAKRELAAARWENLKEAFHQRSYMLRELSGLYVAGYWSENSTRGGNRNVEDAQVAKARASMAAKRNAAKGKHP